MTFQLNIRIERGIMRHLLFTALLASLIVEPAAAQSSKSLHVVLIEGTPRGGASAEVRVAPEARNVVVVGKKASAADLEAAIEIVKHIRAEYGDTLSREIRAVPRAVRQPVPIPGSRAARSRAWMGENLSLLGKRTPEERAGFGKVKAVDLIVDRLAKEEKKARR